jgi:hypothetical protein
MTRIERRRGELSDHRVTSDEQAAAEGEVIARIDLAALTSNNVTYAVHGGPPFHYWNFFPAADEAWCVVPVWGYGTVVESRNADVPAGRCFYGYWPSASHVKLVPGAVKGGGFSDAAAHRQGLAPVYNAYRPADAVDPALAPLVALFQPLFGTAFVLDQLLGDLPRGTTVVLTSASAKTALGTAWNLKQRGTLTVVGLTSDANRAFVERTGLHDRVLGYDGIDALDPAAPAVLVDFAGNGAVTAALHGHLTGLLASHIVGDTHWSAPPASTLPGPAPALFFAPAVWEARAKAIGPAQFEAEQAAALDAFLADARRWLVLEEVRGPDGHAAAFDALLRGRASADRGTIWRP